MKLRYTDRVRIDVNLLAPLPDCMVPPLIFATFVENAFMHGVSYAQPSFVEVSLHTDTDAIVFTCRNNKAEITPDSHQGGVGLENVTKRLDLIYGGEQSYQVNEGVDSYEVVLRLPMRKKKQKKIE